MTVFKSDNSGLTTFEKQQVQDALRRQGFDPGQSDGIFGLRTNAAITAFKRSIGYKPSPYIGPLTWDRLFETKPETALTREKLPWIQEGIKVIRLHEVYDNKPLSIWLKSDGQALGDPAKLPWCFRGDVEIMTEDGWQRFDNLTATRVWQVDADGRMDLTEFFPVEKEYDGPLDVIEHRSFTIHADPAHRWWGQWGTSGRNRAPKGKSFGVLSDLTTAGLRIFPGHAGGPGCGLTQRQIEITAAILSDGTPARRPDGSVREYRLWVSRPHKIDALHDLAPDGHYVQPKAYGPLTTKAMDVFSFLHQPWMSAVITPDKHLDRDFLNSMNADDARVFLRAYRKFDGTAKRFHLYTASAQRRDDLLQIAAMAGWRVGVSIKKGSFNDSPNYELHINPGDQPYHILPRMVRQEHYKGRLYCVTVPKGRIVVRQHGRGPVVTGNCGDFAQTAIRLGLPTEPFRSPLKDNPYWALNWRHFGVPLHRPAYGAIASVSRDGGGHVGFVVGEDASRYYLLGGNQSNRVSVAPLDKTRFVPESWRWPLTWGKPTDFTLPKLTSSEASSINEA